MTWAKLDDGFVDNLKVQPVSWAARGVWATGLCWCSRKLSDGRISAKAAAILEFPPEAIDELVASGLWELAADGNGWVVHDYLEYNPSRDEVKAARAASKVRSNKTRDRRKRCDVAQATSDSNTPPDPDPVLFSSEDLVPKLKPSTNLKPTAPTRDDLTTKLALVKSEPPPKPKGYRTGDLLEDFERLRVQAGGQPLMRTEKRCHSLLQDALTWAKAHSPADPRSACLTSIRGYLADKWRKSKNGWQIQVWAASAGNFYTVATATSQSDSEHIPPSSYQDLNSKYRTTALGGE